MARERERACCHVNVECNGNAFEVAMEIVRLECEVRGLAYESAVKF